MLPVRRPTSDVPTPNSKRLKPNAYPMSRRPPVPADQWTDPRHRLGLDGEDEAIAYLTARGWKVVAHRFRVGRNDIDLVARRGSLVAFVEVKTRQGDGFGLGREAIGWRKRQAIGRVAEVWRMRYGLPEDLFRFDVVEIVHTPSGESHIEHIEDAWRLTR
jgi:putative endonuclease